MATCWTGICVAPTAREPFLDAVVAEDMLAWERYRLVRSAEGLSADAARINWVKLSIDKSLHYEFMDSLPLKKEPKGETNNAFRIEVGRHVRESGSGINGRCKRSVCEKPQARSLRLH